MTHDPFDALTGELSAGGAAPVLDRLAAELRREKKYHDLFDALLMRGRLRLDLPITSASLLDDLPDHLRDAMEAASLEACREVGGLLLDDGRIREAWMYLRPAGDKAAVAAALAIIEPTEQNLNELVEIALYEGVAPALGYSLVLKNYGTCNAITTFEGALMGRPKSDQQAAAALLVRHLHQELVANVRADIARQAGAQPTETTLEALIADRDWLFSENNYHTDTTHLAATIRFARLLEDPADVRVAIDLAEYGRRLSRQFQFAGEEPFVELYLSHGLFFRALLGEEVDEAVAYFRDRATNVDVAEHGTAAAEVFIALLARAGRLDEAIDAAARLIPAGARTSGIAPSLMELSDRAGDYARLIAACRARGDLVGYAAGLVRQSQTAKD